MTAGNRRRRVGYVKVAKKKFDYYFLRLILRATVFVVIVSFTLYEIITKDEIFGIRRIIDSNVFKDGISSDGFWKGFSPLHIVWSFMMLYMLSHLINFKFVSKGSTKKFASRFVDSTMNNPEVIRLTKKFYQKGAIKTTAVYGALNLIIFVLYMIDTYSEHKIFGGHGGQIIIIIQMFFYLSDFICIIFFCPFQKWFMHNKCCKTCRIYDWGAIMMQAPMFYIPNFYAISLAALSLVVFIRWEATYYKHPERFIEYTNCSLSCKNCDEEWCRLKGKVINQERKDSHIL